MLLEINRLPLAFGNHAILNDLSLTVAERELHVLLGANPHFSPGGVRLRKGVGYIEKSSNGQKYSVLIKHAYHGSG